MTFDSGTADQVGLPGRMIAGNGLPQRRSIRLKGYDYSSAGAYCVTICTPDRGCLFGEIAVGEMILNDAGRMVRECWNDIPAHFPFVELDEFVVMPNHLHGILWIINAAGANVGAGANVDVGMRVGAKNLSPLPLTPLPLTPLPLTPLPLTPLQQRTPQPSTNQRPQGTSKTIGSVVRGFKIGVTKWMRQYNVIHDVWQRNYYEHIIRNEAELNRIREYINNNPLNWRTDDLYAGLT